MKAQQLHVFSTKETSSIKIKTLIHSLIISHVCRLIRALSKAKSILVQVLKDNQRKHRQRKLLFGSFRMHYNWCSSHVLPVPTPHWNSIVSGAESNGNGTESQLSGYLQWLEEKGKESSENGGNGEGEDEDGINEIDQLADMFIANCHEKFRLEKQESYRRFQEMMARSM